MPEEINLDINKQILQQIFNLRSSSEEEIDETLENIVGENKIVKTGGKKAKAAKTSKKASKKSAKMHRIKFKRLK